MSYPGHQDELISSSSLALFLRPSQASIVLVRSSRVHPVSSQNGHICIFAGWPTLVCLRAGVYKRTSLMNVSSFPHKCPACLVRLILMVCEIGGNWPWSSCFVRRCFEQLLKTAGSILRLFASNFPLLRFATAQVMRPYSSTDITTACQKSNYILLERSDFHMIDNQSISVNLYPMHTLTSCSVDEILLLRHMNLSTYLEVFHLNGDDSFLFNTYELFCLRSCRGWLIVFYGISTFVGYFTPNPFLCK